MFTMQESFYLVFSISLLGLFLLFINAILFLSTKKYFSKNKLYRALLLYLVIYFIIELSCNIIGFLKPNANIFVSHIAFNFQYLLMSYFFYQLFDSIKFKKAIIWVFVVFTVINSLVYINDSSLFNKFNLFEIAFISLAIITFSLIYIYKNLESKIKYFYFTAGISLYMLTTSLIFLSGNVELVFIEDPYIDIWVFNSLFFIVYQILIYKEWHFLNLNYRDAE